MAAFYDKMQAVAEKLIAARGQTSALRKQTNSGDEWAPTKADVDTDVLLVNLDIWQRRKSGRMISSKNSVVTISTSAGIAPVAKDKIAIGIAAANVTPTTPFSSIIAVDPLSPAGQDLLYEVEVEGHGT